MNLKILLLLLLLPVICLPQNRIKDTVYGNVKSVREKLIFLDSVRQSYKLFADEDEYGHHGFRNRKATQSRFNTFWYTMPIVHYMNYYREYNEKRQITKETWFYKDNSFLARYEFSYDKKGNLTAEKETDEFGGVTDIRFGYHYNNKLSSELGILTPDIGYYFRSRDYDDQGNLILQEFFTEQEKLSELKHEYDNSKRIRTYMSNPYKWVPTEVPGGKREIREWNTVLRFEYDYDNFGNKIVEKEFPTETKGNVPFRITYYTYDKQNNLTSILNDNGDMKFSWEFKYSEKSQILSEKHIVNGKIRIHGQYQYKGDNLVKLIYTEDGITTEVTFQYKFDSHNNWTEQTKSIDGKQLYVRRREIIYY